MLVITSRADLRSKGNSKEHEQQTIEEGLEGMARNDRERRECKQMHKNNPERRGKGKKRT